MHIHTNLRRINKKTMQSNINMNVHNKKIIEFIREKRVITSSELAKFLGMSWNTAEKYLTELIIEGKVEKIKKDGVNLWLLK
mgnify:CR=1 FL=1